jgi:CRP-like cAMP-binding protein
VGEVNRVLARKLGQYADFSEDELADLAALEGEVQEVEPDTELIAEGDTIARCYIVLEGWAVCYKRLPDGRRQVINFMLPGDLLGLRSTLLRVADHSVKATTRLQLARFLVDDLHRLICDQPRIGVAIFWALCRDEAIVVEHLVNMGRRNAVERLAHFILELTARLRVLGLGNQDDYACPLRQEDFADVLGLTTIHINRTFRHLRERQVVTMYRGSLRILDHHKLIEIAGFSDHFLDHGNDGRKIPIGNA